MFEAVDEALRADAEFDDEQDEWDDDVDVDKPAAVSRPWLLPLTALVSLLVLGCLLSGALGVGAMFWATRPEPTKPLLVENNLSAPLPAEALTVTLPISINLPITQSDNAPDQPLDPAAPQPLAPEPTLAGQVPPDAPPPALGSPLPSPQPTPTLQQSKITPPTSPPPTATTPPTPAPTRTVPPTFTAVAATLPPTPTVTVLVLTSTYTPTPARTLTPAFTPTITPTLTPTPPIGSVVLIGTIRINTINKVGTPPNQLDEYVEIENIGNAAVSLPDFALRYVIPGRNPADPPGDFDFPADANVLYAGETLRVYTFQLRVPGASRFYSWQHEPGNLWPDVSTQRVSVILINIKENREYARFTY